MKLERDKIYLDRNGDKWRVVCVDGGTAYPVIAYRTEGDFFELRRFNLDGTFTSKPGHDYDLIREHKEPREFNLVRCKDGHHGTYDYPTNVRPETILECCELIKVRECGDE